MKDYSDIVNRARNRKKEEEDTNSSSSRSLYDATSVVEKTQLRKKIGFDTFESDLQSIGSTLGNIYGDWQTQETMANTRASVESMQKRLTDYQTYRSKYGSEETPDLSELLNGYQTALNDWDNISSMYGYYENADAYRTARKKAEMDSTFGGLTYDEAQERLKQYSPDSDEYKYLSTYTGYTNLTDFDKALQTMASHGGGSSRRGSGETTALVEGDDTYKTALETKRNQYELDHAFDRYSHYVEAEDFAEKSQYVSTKSDKWHSGLTSQYGLGYDDVVYEYINDVDGARAKIKEGASTFGRDTGDGVSSMEKKGYDKLTEEEKAVYNYLYRKEGKEKAEEFLAYMESNLEKRVEDESTQKWEEFADKGVLQSAVASAISVPANIYGAFYSTVDSVGDALQGKEYSPYGYYKMPSNISSDIREHVGENIAGATEGMELFGQNIPAFLYQTGMSIADTSMGATMLGSAYSPIMGASAFQQRAKELKEAGASEEEVIRGAGASAVFEMVFEKLSIDNLFKIKNADSWFKVVKETAKQAGIEGSEEFLTEVANVVFDRVSRGEESDVYKMYEEYLARGFSEEEAERKVKQDINAQIGFAFAGGALSGTAMGTGASLNNYSNLSSTGKQIRDNDRVQDMADLQGLMEMQGLTPEQSEAYKLYGEYAKKGFDNISNARLGNLYQIAQREAVDTLGSKKSTETQKTDASKRLGKLAVVATSKPIDERAREQRVEELTKGEETTVGGETAKVEGIRIEDGSTIVLTSQGEAKAEDMTFSSTDAEILAYAESMGEEKGNLFLSQYDGKADVDAFATSFEMAYAYGEVGMDADSVLRNKGVLTEAQASAIYTTAITNKVSQRQKAIDTINKKQSSNVFVKGKFDDSIIDYDGTVTDGSKVAWKDLTIRQRDAITFVKGFSEATGINISLIKSNVKDGKRVGKNGSYNSATNTIEIDVYAGIIDVSSAEETIIPVLSHEVTHWMKAKSPALYSKIQAHALETLKMQGITTEDRVNAEMKRIERNHPDVKATKEMALDEIVARYCEDMLANSKKTRELLGQMSESEQKSFIAKVKETFANLMEWVDKLLSQYKSNSAEATFLRGYKDRLKEASEMWDKALEEAIQVNQSLQAEGITGEKAIEMQWADRVEDQFGVDATVEQTDKLIAVHNLSEEKLLKTLKLGGFPMPSIAVTKASIGHKGFGSISLLFSKDTIDPQLFRSNKVYSGDAWTPTYPTISYKVNDKVERRASDKYYELGKRLGYEEVRPLYRYAVNLEETLNRDGGEKAMLERLYEDTGVMQVFLQDTGRGKVAPIEREIREEITEAEKEFNEAFIEAFGKEVLAEFQTPKNMSAVTHHREFIANHKEDIVEAYRKVMSELYGFTDTQVENVISNMSQLDFVMTVRKAFVYTQNNGVSVTVETDTDATNEAIRKASVDGYKEWVDSLFKGAEEKKGIRNSKDYYTSEGNPRSWEVLHYEETLENVIKVMKEQGEKGIGMGGKNIFGASTESFESISDIQKAGKGLRSVSQEEFWEMKEGYTNRLWQLANSLAKYYSATSRDDASELMVEAISKFKTREGIANYIKKEGKGWTNYSDEIVDGLISLVEDIRTMPRNYFEAKPLRVVGFDEIAYAVIPNDASQEVRSALEEIHVPMKEYQSGNEDSRVDAVNSIEGIQFSDREYVAAEDKGLMDFAISVINGSASKKAYHDVNERIPDDLADEISRLVGFDVHGFGNEIDQGQTEHIWIEHGENGSSDQSLADVRDISKMGYVVAHFDKVRKGKDKSKYKNSDGTIAQTIEIQKRIGNAYYYVVEAVPDAKIKKLRVVTAYINKKDTFTEVAVSNDPSRYVQDEFQSNASINSIAQSSENGKTQFSDRDTSGRELSEGQKRYFTNSKIRDVEGNLKVMYHGSGASFTVFDKKKAKSSGYYGRGFYFTESESHAKQYGSNYEVYLNITNPMVEDTHDVTKKQLRAFVEAVADNEDYGIENYGYGATVDSVVDSIYGKDDFGMIMDINATCIGDFVEAIQLFNEVNGTTYDGIVVPTETVAFYPNQIKDVKNLNPTEHEDMHYSDRENVSIYDVMGETESLKKQNEILQADIEALKERLKLEKQVTRGNTFNAKQLKAVAKHLKNLAKSDYSEDALVEELREVYSYIVENPQLDWEVLMAKSYDVARRVLDTSKGYKVTNDYFKEVLADIRKARISLSEEQIQEAKNAYGEKYRNAFMGRIMLVKDGTSLDRQWQEWVEMYPEIFDANITGADQITALSDIYDTLREGAEMYQTFNDTESIRAFATEIYNQYWNVSTIQTTADKYDKQIKRINYEHRKAMGELREDYKKRVAEQKKADSIYYGRVISNLRQQRDERVKEARAYGKKRMDEHKDRLERDAKIKSIKTKTRRLNELLEKNSKEKHISEELKPMVRGLIQAIDYETSRQEVRKWENAGISLSLTEDESSIINQSTQAVEGTKAKMTMLDALYKVQRSLNTVDFYGFSLEGEIDKLVDALEKLKEQNRYPLMVLNAMSLDQLETINKLVGAVSKVVSDANKLHTKRRNLNADNLGGKITHFLDELGVGKVYKDVIEKYRRTFKWKNTVPYYAFKRLGEGGKELFSILQDGWDKLAFNVNEILTFANSVYTEKDVKKWSKEVKSFTVGGTTFKMTDAQIMSLYCLWNREQGKKHILKDGIRVGNFDSGIKVVNQTKDIKVTKADVEKILSSLSDKQIAVADKIREFMNTVCKDWGNYISMERFGFKAFTEENYFPIEVDENNLRKDKIKDNKNVSLYALLNSGFTKSLDENAKNAIIVNNIFDVFANHASEMAKYNALGLAVLDFNRVMNYSEDREGQPYSIRTAMEAAYGKDAELYFHKLIADLNGTQSVSRDTLGRDAMSKAKLGAIGWNMKTVLLQPFAYFKASAVLHRRYLASSVVTKPHLVKRGIERAQKYCGLALWKSMGFYDTNISRGVVSQIKHDATWKDKLAEASTKLMEKADEITIGALWNACELEVKNLRKDLDFRSDEFFEAVADKLREVIYATQVVDSTLTRSEMMRSGDEKDKMLTAFGSEPTLAYNMLLDCVMETSILKRSGASKEELQANRRKVARVLEAYTVTNLVTAVLETFVYVFREEDELEEEEILKMMLENFAMNMGIIGKIPYLKDIVSIFKGYSPSRLDTQGWQSLYYAFKSIQKNLEGEGSVLTTLRHLLKAYSSLEGLGFWNAYRDTMALLDNLDILSTEELEEMLNEILE